MLYPALLGIFGMTKYSLTLPKPSPNPNIIIKYKILISMGVSICLDVVSIETLDLDTGKGWSRQSRKSLHFQNLSLDNREVSIEIEKSRFCLDTTFQSQKSRLRSRNMSRHDIFGKSRQFVSISIES
jgi:hypothetical protein